MLERVCVCDDSGSGSSWLYRSTVTANFNPNPNLPMLFCPCVLFKRQNAHENIVSDFLSLAVHWTSSIVYTQDPTQYIWEEEKSCALAANAPHWINIQFIELQNILSQRLWILFFNFLFIFLSFLIVRHIDSIRSVRIDAVKNRFVGQNELNRWKVSACATVCVDACCLVRDVNASKLEIERKNRWDCKKMNLHATVYVTWVLVRVCECDCIASY